MNASGSRPIPYRELLALISTLLLAACGSLTAPQTVSQNIYVLEAGQAIQAAQMKRDLVLAVSMPRTRPGFDTSQMAYVQQSYELNYFAASRWAETPARMLEPLITQTLIQSGGFRAVVRPASAIPADVRLDIELVRLQQNFQTHPSRMQLTLRAQLIDIRGKRLLAEKQFDEVEDTSSDDAYGGVAAANRLVQRLLAELAEFCVNSTEHAFESASDRP